MPDAKYVEHTTPSAYMDNLSVEPPALDDEGYLPIPKTPGLGMALDPDKVAAYSAGQVYTFC
jgi:D-galactarolactone cycloisomerase